MMEYPSKYDFFLSFKALINDDGHFVDYILVSLSDNFQNATNIKAERILGRKISEIVLEYENDVFGIKDIYYNMIPKTRRKFEKHIYELDRWYSINIFSDDRDYLILFYNDISRIKKSKESSADHIRNRGEIYDLEEKREYFGYKDKLTGLYNRDFFDEELSRLDSFRQLPISVIIGDLNGLKLINDAFGHDMGDKALKRVAEIMKRAFRKEDIVSRVGGDEFVVLLPKTTEKTALSIVNRIKEDCIANPLDFIKISISFGAATKKNGEEDIFEIYRKAEDRMYFNKLTESKEAKLSMIKYLKDRLEEISFETKAHYERLKGLCLMLADKLGLSDIEKEELKLLCEFHDIGKIGIPSQILQKKGALNSDEWERVRRHSEIGYHIIGASRETLAIDELILIHHERWDGKGYPGLLKQDEIPHTVRIFAIADSYDAMVNDRPYKSAINNAEALREIESKAGTQFDPYLAKIFVQMMRREEVAI
ncbi:HD-GYP domain-containing protein [Lutispora sp.]|uniref:HD-GYP domain-containing protein n=1 Tax=Lutispora sp. TaxID=2828727 RepID=UPI002B1F0482|nr:diguanylate cyclase [Lutispora sp.]MEA4963537.1 diguanylate cyclase [Lutispora sp.]